MTIFDQLSSVTICGCLEVGDQKEDEDEREDECDTDEGDNSEEGNGGTDRDSRTAAVALAVAVGYFCDPPGYGGLAHFLEHMLFMGTRDYPDENELVMKNFESNHQARSKMKFWFQMGLLYHPKWRLYQRLHGR